MAAPGTRCCETCDVIFDAAGSRERFCSLRCAFYGLIDASGGDDACWPCVLKPIAAGYVMIRARGESEYAHRLACEIAHGPIPDGFYATHGCDNPPCCNYRHVRPGSPSDNSNEMYARNRQGDRNYARGDRHPRRIAAQKRSAVS